MPKPPKPEATFRPLRRSRVPLAIVSPVRFDATMWRTFGDLAAANGTSRAELLRIFVSRFVRNGGEIILPSADAPLSPDSARPSESA